MVTYKATILPDPNKASIASSRGMDSIAPRWFTHERLDLVEHWAMHVYMDYPDALIEIVMVTEEAV
jgi:hypothetical protein